MKIVENTLDESIEAVLERPLFCFLAQRSIDGEPRISPLWYHWVGQTMWIIGDTQKTYTTRIRHHPTTAIAVVDFDPQQGHVRHIGMRGEASIEALDDQIVESLLSRYLGDDPDGWDPKFHNLDHERWCLIRFEPETVVARNQSYMPSSPSSADIPHE